MKPPISTTFSILLAIAIVLTLTTCKQPTTETSTKSTPGIPAFNPAIAAFTSGTISGQSAIQVVLAEDYPEVVAPNTPVGKKVFRFKPDIEGTAYWADSRTIEFRPAKALPASTVFQASFLLAELPGIATDAQTFDFGFQTISQGFIHEIEGLVSKHKNRSDCYQLRGLLRTADHAAPDIIANMLEVNAGGNTLPVTWIHETDGRIHHFEVDSVPRQNQRYKLQLRFNGRPLDLDISQTHEVEIPAKDVFEIINIAVEQFPRQSIVCRFSDPLDEKQNLDGLIQIVDQRNILFTINNNILIIHPTSPLTGSHTLVIDAALRNYSGQKLAKQHSESITFEPAKPEVRLPGKGVILPNSGSLILPFEAISLRAVEVRVIKLYEENIPYFLQANNIGGDYELKRAGRLMLKKTLLLGTGTPVDLQRWNTFSLDLASLIEPDPGAIYRIEMGFKKIHSAYPCADTEKLPTQSELDVIDKTDFEREVKSYDFRQYWYYDDYYYEYWDYDDDYNTWYQRRSDPCYPQYFGSQHNVSRNILASDLGVIAKQGNDGKLSVLVSDLISARPMQNIKVEVRNFQNRIIAEGSTNDQGMLVLEPEGVPFLVIAKHGKQRAYLRLDSGQSLPVSNFDVSGDVVQLGLKGFLYGERGVWRPGDTLFLTFILEDQQKNLPSNHPVSFELLNPMGQTYDRITKTQGMNGFYTFTTRTAHDAPTGNWTSIIRVGGAEFRQRIKIESIKPNRLKIELDFNRKIITQQPSTRATLKAEWLHGARARSLKADVKVKLSPARTQFSGWNAYQFTDPTKRFETEEKTLFDGTLDETGQTSFIVDMPGSSNAPGMLTAFFATRVFEEGGDFSIDGFEAPFSPYDSYVGLKPPPTTHYGMLETGRDHLIELASLDLEGNPHNERNLYVEVYKIDWNWWWSSYGSNLAHYMRQQSRVPVFSYNVMVTNGRGSCNIHIPDSLWGQYYIRAFDNLSGHSAGFIHYFDWPSMAGRARRSAPQGSSMLTFTLDKEKYNPGDVALVTFPSDAGSSAVISIENGSRIIDIFRVGTQEKETVVKIPVTAEMIPNVYVHISLLQPHGQTVNDLPIRLYGILPMMVEDPATRLQPLIAMPDVLEPEKPFKVTISEKNNQEMTFTLAIVDEGLLSLTRFATPDPWTKFFAREALGVKTWDLYDQVIGAFGGRFEQMFSIGGDDEFIQGEDANLANRFKPVVKFLGPFTIKPNEKKELSIELPQYVGSVRTMVIAGNTKAYGFAHKQTPVRKPLMLLATLPRMLGPGETFSLPVTVFAMEPDIRNVEVSVQLSDIFSSGSLTKTVLFEEPGDQTIFFEFGTKRQTGIGAVKVKAVSGNHSAAHDIEIGIRNPNTSQTVSTKILLEAVESKSIDYALFGLPGTNSLNLELSTIPPIDLTNRLRYLLRYPHGCFEQTVSGAFPQLFISSVITLNDLEKKRIEINVKDGLQRLRSFQLPDGSFTSWPGHNYTDEWSTSYAGHFMLEAEALGYAIPPGIKSQWISYQQLASRAWGQTTPATRYAYRQSDLVQAYRLFTLALAQSPETGAMNRLRERTDLSLAATWRLAAAYALIGQQNVAQNMIRGLDKNIREYPDFSNTYGSRERDWAMILETLIYMNEREKAYDILQQLSEALSSGMWMSTQSTAYSLLAVSKFLGGDKTSHEINAGIKQDDEAKKSIKEITKIFDVSLATVNPQGKIQIENRSKAVLFARLFTVGIPAPGDEIASESNIQLSIRYTDAAGKTLDVNQLRQGTDVVAEISVTNPSHTRNITDIALTQVFPSGWEIGNLRLFDQAGSNPSRFTYQDIRDDRVMTYFDLDAREKKTFKVSLTAAYLGKFYLPAPQLEAMYDRSIHSSGKGKWVEVVR
jgi:alpha-2-macroglobulin